MSTRFVFSYNPSDADLLTALPSSSHSQLTRIVPSDSRNGLGLYADDDDIPIYGPTTHRRGRMRFVPASDGGLGATRGQEGEVYAPLMDKGKGRALDDDEAEAREDLKREDEPAQERNEEEEKPPSPAPVKRTGASVRGLYESILQQHNAPASRRASPAPPVASTSPSAPTLSARHAASSPPPPPPRRNPVPAPPPAREADLVLSSDSEPDGAPPRPPRPRKRPRPAQVAPSQSAVHPPERAAPAPHEAKSDDDDLVVLDPSTGLPVPSLRPFSPAPPSFSLRPPPLSSRPAPLKIHELLPPPSAAPHAPPLQYALRPDNPGWRMLARQGWTEGRGLGPDRGTLPGSGEAGEPGEREGGEGDGGPGGALKVPLRAVEKHDRLGLGAAGTTKAEQRRLTPLEREAARAAREAKEREERERRGKGARGMERVRRREERERKAWIGYMNR
ncbi:hypothetical protein JCM10207_002430 [Rhodosporidiobolus poonsookiae]